MKQVTLSEISELLIGKTPSRNQPLFWGGDNSWLSIRDMTGCKYINKTKECITAEGIDASGIKLIPSNTVLLSYKLSIGKVAITKQPIYTNEAIAAVHLKPEYRNHVDIDYLYHTLSNHNFQQYGDRAVMGLTLNKAKLSKIKIPLPPLEEQKRIAAILDKADEIKRKREQAIALADELLQSVFLDMFGDPVTNPKGWPVKKLGEAFSSQKEGTKCGPFGSALKKNEFTTVGIPVWRMDNIQGSNSLPILDYFGKLKLGEIKRKDIKAFQNWRRTRSYAKHGRKTEVSNATINRDIACLSTFFEWCIEEEYLYFNPAKKCKLLENNKRIVYLSEPQVAELFQKASPYMRRIVSVAIMTGFRMDNIATLKWEQVDLKNGIISLWVKHKGGKVQKHFPMRNALVLFLRKLRSDEPTSEFVITYKDLPVKNFSHAWRLLREKLTFKVWTDGSNFRFHDLRHCFGSYLRLQGFELHEIKELMGHESEAMTLRYAHLDPRKLKPKLDNIKEQVDILSFDVTDK